MRRESMVFYASWLDAVRALPKALQGDVLLSILEYGIEGKTVCKQGSVTAAMLTMVKPIIDANNKRYENGCRGGRPKPNGNQTETTLKPNGNQTETYNDNDNVNVNDNVDVEDTTTTPAPECENGVFIPSADLAERMKADTRWLAAVSANTSTPIDTLKAMLDDFGKQVAMTEDAKELVDARRHFLSWMRKRKQAPTGRPTDGGRPYRLMTYEQMIADKDRNGRATTEAYVAVKVRGQRKPMWVTKADKEAYQIPDEL